MSENSFSVSESYAAEPVDSEALPPERGPTFGFSLVEIAAVLFVIAIMVGLVVPAIGSLHDPARRMQCPNNLKQLSLALLEYENAYGSFPPAYTVDAKGNRLHSWRTLILPFIEQQPLYSKIDLSKPWDHPANAKLSSKQISVYECPSAGISPGSSTYFVVDDPSGIFNGSNTTKIAQIQDGTSNTLLIVEVDKSLAVPWMSPDDIDLKTYLDVKFSSGHTGGANCCFADGACWFLDSSLDRASMRALVTKSAGDKSNNAFP
ncbi:MAG: DUF1559 domain-containing protein [Planctomycetota bacterium]